MHTKKKEDLTETEAKQNYLEMISNYENYHLVFTDGSVRDERTGCAVVIGNRSYKYRLPNNTNIFMAELLALSRAIDKIDEIEEQNFLICCDSQSALQAVQGGTPNSLVHQILDKLSTSPKTICLEWVPSHINIPVNNLADKMAKEALNMQSIEVLPLEYCDLKILIKNFLSKCWQRHWDRTNEPPNDTTKLYPIKPVLQDWKSSNRRNRSEEIILARLRFGTCLLNKKHLFTGEPFPFCTPCQTNLTIAHLLIDCPEHRQKRKPMIDHLNRERLHPSLENILNDNFPHDLLIKFLDQTGYLKKI